MKNYQYILDIEPDVWRAAVFSDRPILITNADDLFGKLKRIDRYSEAVQVDPETVAAYEGDGKFAVLEPDEDGSYAPYTAFLEWLDWPNDWDSRLTLWVYWRGQAMCIGLRAGSELDLGDGEKRWPIEMRYYDDGQFWERTA